MVILWIMALVGLLVVAPVVVVLAGRVIRPALESARYADDILVHGVGLSENVAPIPALVSTRELVADVTANAVAYVTALRRLV